MIVWADCLIVTFVTQHRFVFGLAIVIIGELDERAKRVQFVLKGKNKARCSPLRKTTHTLQSNTVLLFTGLTIGLHLIPSTELATYGLTVTSELRVLKAGGIPLSGGGWNASQ